MNHPIAWATLFTAAMVLAVFFWPVGKTYTDAMIRLTYAFFALVLSHALWVVVAIHGALT